MRFKNYNDALFYFIRAAKKESIVSDGLIQKKSLKKIIKILQKIYKKYNKYGIIRWQVNKRMSEYELTKVRTFTKKHTMAFNNYSENDKTSKIKFQYTFKKEMEIVRKEIINDLSECNAKQAKDIVIIIDFNKYTQIKNNENNENNENNINTNISKKEINNKNSKVSYDNQKEDFNGIYWDLGWIDVKNKLYYETSVYFNIEYKPERLVFFENFIDFLQIFIDKRICDQLFTFFNFDLSVLAASDRYLSKKIFEAKLTSVLDEEIKSTVTEEQIRNKEVNEKNKEIQRFIQFICNMLCGYDEDNNIRNDSISFSLLKKKDFF
jgi:hypothetical protein